MPCALRPLLLLRRRLAPLPLLQLLLLRPHTLIILVLHS
jgi:hypothetical protein